ncbi:MAG: hypothetical protein Q8M31_22205 [Beijerinckiaceae bacterium]|nr:hypothetical protein [Beijerinckiaceae bacterium]
MRTQTGLFRLMRSLLPGCISITLGLSASTSASAQASTGTGSGFYLGFGGSFNSVNADAQQIYARGTSDVFNSAGTMVQTGSADGPPVPVFMDSQLSLAPSVQAGYFQHFANSGWFWGGKVTYSYLNTTSTTRNALIPQVGSFTTLSTGAVTPFTGNALISNARATVLHQLAFIPSIGHSFGKFSLYAGAGPTLSQVRTNLNGLVGFADINGTHTDVSGAAQNFADSNWVGGIIGMIGTTYFVGDSWYLDLNYSYAASRNQTSKFASNFSNPNGLNDTSMTGTLVGSSTWKVITQSVGVSINKLF